MSKWTLEARVVAMVAALAGASTAMADDMHLAPQQAPRAVLAAVHRLQSCAATTRVRAGGHWPFVYCGTHIDWDPKRANGARRCLAQGVIAMAAQHPSLHEPHATTYNVSIGCQGLVVVQVDYDKGVARVIQAEEALP
jgi:hypothetical protein